MAAAEKGVRVMEQARLDDRNPEQVPSHEVEGYELLQVRGGMPLRNLVGLPGLLAPQRAFEVLGVSRSRGYEMLKSGDIPSIELGGRRWVRTAELAREVFGIDLQDLMAGDGRG